MKKIALLTATPCRTKDGGMMDLGSIEYDTESQRLHFLPVEEFWKWRCDLEHNILGLQDRALGDGLGLRISPIGESIFVTFTNHNDEGSRDFLLTSESIDDYHELFS